MGVHLRWFRQKRMSGMVGVEIRPDMIGLAWAKRNRTSSQLELVGLSGQSASAAQRKTVLGEMVTSAALKGAHCNLVLPPDQYQMFQIERPAVEESELADALRWKVKDLIDYPVDDAVIDAFSFPADAVRGRTPLLNVICARKAMLMDQINLLKEVGLTVHSIDISELVLRNIAMRFDPDAKGIALLYLRGSQGMVLMCKGDTLYFYRRVEFDVEALNDLSRQEELVQQLALQVQRSLDYYESQMGQIPPAQLILFKVSDEVALGLQLGSYLAVKVRELDQSELLADSVEINVSLNDGLIAIGAALRQELSS
ncbi:MAG: hypothetical protein H6999_02310 [Hahellaceae bacterium]|nr:hypothetical protein [Hahellaceae bacterium]MCP5168575.1 hypothetical protein [Hahellaceae bacterium]